MNHPHSYRRLGLMTLLSFAVMYVLMYSMVNSFLNIFPNYNQFYMAGLMAMPMVLIELWFMRDMYTDKKANVLIIIFTLILFALFWIGIRQQVAIGDQQFLKSMIPHHAGAILMCEQTNFSDPEIQTLCQNIISGQQSEIDFMKSKLKR